MALLTSAGHALLASAFMLLKSTQRPRYEGAEDIGSWRTVLEAIGVLGVITNVRRDGRSPGLAGGGAPRASHLPRGRTDPAPPSGGDAGADNAPAEAPAARRPGGAARPARHRRASDPAGT